MRAVECEYRLAFGGELPTQRLGLAARRCVWDQDFVGDANDEVVRLAAVACVARMVRSGRFDRRSTRFSSTPFAQARGSPMQEIDRAKHAIAGHTCHRRRASSTTRRGSPRRPTPPFRFSSSAVCISSRGPITIHPRLRTPAFEGPYSRQTWHFPLPSYPTPIARMWWPAARCRILRFHLPYCIDTRMRKFFPG